MNLFEGKMSKTSRGEGGQSLQLGPFFRTTVRLRTFLRKLVQIWSVLCEKSPIFVDTTVVAESSCSTSKQIDQVHDFSLHPRADLDGEPSTFYLISVTLAEFEEGCSAERFNDKSLDLGLFLFNWFGKGSH